MLPRGEVLAVSQAPKTPADWSDKSLECLVLGEASVFVAMEQALKVMVMGCAHALYVHAQVACLADHLQC